MTTTRILVEQDNDNPADVSAMELGQYPDGSPRGGREAIIDSQEAALFMADCADWNWIVNQYEGTYGETVQVTAADRFRQGGGVVLNIDTATWNLWLADCEVVEPIDSNCVAAFSS